MDFLLVQFHFTMSPHKLFKNIKMLKLMPLMLKIKINILLHFAYKDPNHVFGA